MKKYRIKEYSFFNTRYFVLQQRRFLLFWIDIKLTYTAGLIEPVCLDIRNNRAELAFEIGPSMRGIRRPSNDPERYYGSSVRVSSLTLAKEYLVLIADSIERYEKEARILKQQIKKNMSTPSKYYYPVRNYDGDK